jgi:hypothetical protein
MAKIHEEVVVIKLSRLIKESDTDTLQNINSDNLSAIEAIVQELVGDSVVVEVEKA